MTRAPGKARIRIRLSRGHERVSRVVRSLGLHTVCEEALCPNIGECWGEGTATFLILGDVCTRGCRFCYVRRGKPRPPDPTEPARIARAVRELGLDYVTITSVTRDDLPDGGAGHYAMTVRAVKEASPGVRVEVLVPDFRGDPRAVETVASSGVDVFAHNIETVERLTPTVRDPRAGYRQSLRVLELAKEVDECLITKSSILLGLGEEWSEVIEAMRDLRSVGVDVLVISQYLRPSPRQLPVARVYKVSEFQELRSIGLQMGFSYVHAHPLARTSHKAKEAYLAAVRGRPPCTR